MQQGYVSLKNNRVIRGSLCFVQRRCPGPLEGPKMTLTTSEILEPDILGLLGPKES